ncbi:MAG: oligosaccharide flippase family protein [Vicinamibacteria bacterium]|nr:oligosaccharide flippase family protein [Vicinamibacteria bacterium]
MSHLRRLAGQALIYGSADVFCNVISFLLLPLYTTYLTLEDYGVLGILALFSAAAKIVFRLGLESAFFRLHYDQHDPRDQQRLAGTVFFFAILFGALLFVGIAFGAPWLMGLLFSRALVSPRLLILAAADIFLGVFLFVPLSLLRIESRPQLFSAFSIFRHTLNILLKIALVMRGWGVAGVLWADVIATAALAAGLMPLLKNRIAFALSRPFLRELLALGLPRVPHGLMIQVQNLADRRILESFVALSQVGLYQVGYQFGMAVKFALSAFEPAWQPFVYSQIKDPQAPRLLARLATYSAAAFLMMGLATAVLSPEMVVVMTAPAYHGAAAIVPIVALAYLLHGAFLLTSIGINIAKQARYYPIITLFAATTNVALNFLWIPKMGMLGAAWATVASYSVMAGLGFAFSRRLYPIPFEFGRLTLLVSVALCIYAGSLFISHPPAASPLLRVRLLATLPAILCKTLLLLAYPLGLAAAGFLRAEEWGWLRRRIPALRASP